MAGFVNILDLGADPAGSVECNGALTAAQASGDTIIVPSGLFKLSPPFSFASGRTWLFQGGTFIHSDDGLPMFLANDIEDLTLLGNLKCRGLLAVNANTGESAIRFDNVNRCYVQRITATLFKGVAVQISGASAGTFRGDTLKIDSLSVHENRIGLNVLPGSGGEYAVIGTIEATGNIVAVSIGAGNTRILGGNIVDNANGVDLLNGANHGHGGFHGVNINHNAGFNLRAVGVTNGFNFDSCNFYGDSATAGKIILSGSAGITISDGVLSAAVEATGPYVNSIRDNFITGPAAITGAGAANIIRSGNYTQTGFWPANNY